MFSTLSLKLHAESVAEHAYTHRRPMRSQACAVRLTNAGAVWRARRMRGNGWQRGFLSDDTTDTIIFFFNEIRWTEHDEQPRCYLGGHHTALVSTTHTPEDARSSLPSQRCCTSSQRMQFFRRDLSSPASLQVGLAVWVHNLMEGHPIQNLWTYRMMRMISRS